MNTFIAPAGLSGVVVADTSIGDVRGEEGFFHYRQFDATQLAEHRSFEDVWHLVLFGDFPSSTWTDTVRTVLAVDPAIRDAVT